MEKHKCTISTIQIQLKCQIETRSRSCEQTFYVRICLLLVLYGAAIIQNHNIHKIKVYLYLHICKVGNIFINNEILL